MSDYVRLSGFECIPGRPFTDPEHSQHDLSALDQMRASLRQLLPVSAAEATGGWEALPAAAPAGRRQAVTIARPATLLNASELTVVGFFGHRRPGVDLAPLQEVDEALRLQFDEYPGVLSYSRLELDSGDWGNLVILSDPTAGHNWQTSELHAYAARQLAPQCYHSVRLHNASLPAGLFGPAGIRLIRTRYFDYAEPLPWIAVREYA